jgi:hypothetical protein
MWVRYVGNFTKKPSKYLTFATIYSIGHLVEKQMLVRRRLRRGLGPLELEVGIEGDLNLPAVPDR